MRKAILLVCAITLILSSFTCAMASESFWTIKLRAGNIDVTSYSGSISNALIGACPDPPTVGVASFVSSAANMAIWPDNTSAQWVNSSLPAPYVFNVRLAVGTGYQDFYGGQVFISAWSPETYAGVTGRSLPSSYVVKVSRGATTLATWTHDVLGVTNELAANEVGPTGFWYAYQGRVGSFAESSDSFTITVSSVPEPTSLLLLGSGLVGALGFIVRKRKE
jgi:hypothetical protein